MYATLGVRALRSVQTRGRWSPKSHVVATAPWHASKKPASSKLSGLCVQCTPHSETVAGNERPAVTDADAGGSTTLPARTALT